MCVLGYAPFRWYIHNVTGAKLNTGSGAKNVLSVHVRPTQLERPLPPPLLLLVVLIVHEGYLTLGRLCAGRCAALPGG